MIARTAFFLCGCDAPDVCPCLCATDAGVLEKPDNLPTGPLGDRFQFRFLARGMATRKRNSWAELYPLLRVVMGGRGWSTAYVSPRHHRDLLAGPEWRSFRRSHES